MRNEIKESMKLKHINNNEIFTFAFENNFYYPQLSIEI